MRNPFNIFVTANEDGESPDVDDLWEKQAKVNFYWPYVDFRDTGVSLGYWDRPNYLIPDVAKPRTYRLKEYGALYEGDFRTLRIDPRFLIGRTDDFTIVPKAYANTILAYPPTITDENGNKIEGLDMQELIRVSHTLATHQIVYGFGLATIYQDDDDSWHLDALDPRYWHPSGKKESAYIDIKRYQNSDGSRSEKYLATVTVYNNTQTVTYSYEASESHFGRLLWEPQLGSFDKYPIQICALETEDINNWPHSMFESMVNAVVANTTLSGVQYSIVKYHERPNLLPIRTTNMGDNFDRDATEAQLEIISHKIEEGLEQTVLLLPPQYDDAKYLTWDGKLDASFKMREMLQDDLVRITGIPTSIYGVLRGGAQPSAATLRELSLVFFANIKNIQLAQMLTLTPLIEQAFGVTPIFNWPDIAEESAKFRQTVEPESKSMAETRGNAVANNSEKNTEESNGTQN